MRAAGRGTNGMRRAGRDALFLPQAARQRPSRKGRVGLAFPAALSGLGKWPNNRAAPRDHRAWCVCVCVSTPSVCVRPGVCGPCPVCAPRHACTLGRAVRQGEDPLLGFPGCQAGGWIISFSAHSHPGREAGTRNIIIQGTGTERATDGKPGLGIA